jgi:hypothetical protein
MMEKMDKMGMMEKMDKMKSPAKDGDAGAPHKH